MPTLSPSTKKRRFWLASDQAMLAEMYSDLPTSQVAAALDRDVSSVYRMAAKLGLKKSESFLDSPESGRLRKGQTRPGTEKTQFRKGNVPANKGLKQPGWAPGRMADTQFQKGCRSGIAATNWVPVGTVKADTDGYLRIKVREAVHGKEATGFGNTRVWPFCHRHMWEQANGPIPAGHVVIFRDGNRANVTLENLEMISMAENASRNSMWKKLPRELAEAIQLNSALKKRMRRLYGEKQNH